MHVISKKALLFKRPNGSEVEQHHVRPSSEPQAAPEWIKEDPFFAICKKSGSIRQVKLVEDVDGEQEDAAAGTPTTPAKSAKGKGAKEKQDAAAASTGNETSLADSAGLQQ